MKITSLFTMLLLLFTVVAAQTPAEINVAAYNVEFSDKGTAREIGAALMPYDFDIICFSEAPGGTWAADVANSLGMEYYVTGRYSTAGHKDKYKVIVCKTPLYGYEEVLMADTFHTATKAFTRIGETVFSIYSIHFPFGWRDQAHIDETTGKISAFVNYLRENESGPAIPLVMGDFNFILSQPEKASPYYDMHRHAGYASAWPALHIDVTNLGTMVKFVPKGDGNGRVIDHILYKPSLMRPIDGGIIEMEHPLSDHKPVWAKLRIGE
ncbi:endonuclease/exonuclease/phosphatase family protein [Parapedobacter sp. GCM10030251]|uniref:endonuclease/exonuclease/phosphatase family protein n=1 Tax=Parapedobacter sp. GCM10030251 TaxID=3273419 RepID=UPI0036098E3D